MRKNHLIVLQAASLICAVLLTSCNKGYESPLSGRTFEDITLGPELSSKIISFEGEDMSHVQAKASEIWCQAYVRGTEMVVNATDNNTYSDRTSSVDVHDYESGDHITFKVTQLQNGAIIPEQSTYEVPAEGGLVYITLKTNLDTYEKILHADWLLPVNRAFTRGLQEVQDYVSVPENESGDIREGYVEFVNKDVGASSKVLIRQLANPYLQLDKTIVSVGESGGEIEITVSTNVDFRAEVESSQSWVQVGTKSEIDKYQYLQKLQVSALPEGTNSRRCVVYFAKTDLSMSRMLTIEQNR